MTQIKDFCDTMRPYHSVPMCTCTFRYPVRYDEDMKEILKHWEVYIGPTSMAQIKRLIFYRGLLSFKDSQGYVDLNLFR